jgi:hypothetical protein
MNDECTFMDDCTCSSCTKQNRIEQLERELHESRQREGRLREALKIHGGHSAYCKSVYAVVPCDCGLDESLSSTTTPAETMVPWSVVKESADAEFAVQYAYQDEIEEAIKRRDAARAKLQSYAPKGPAMKNANKIKKQWAKLEKRRQDALKRESAKKKGQP